MNKTVEFSTAKLLKDKGCDIETQDYFLEDGIEYSYPKKENWNLKPDTISSPTIADVVMWLYEKHGIWISVVPYNDEELSQTLWENSIIYISDDYNNCSDYTFYHAPTEAYEAAFNYILTDLIK